MATLPPAVAAVLEAHPGVKARWERYLVTDDPEMREVVDRLLAGAQCTCHNGGPEPEFDERCPWHGKHGLMVVEGPRVSRRSSADRREAVNHPDHYGGDTVYEVIKVLEAWGLGFHLGNAVKYIARAGKKGGPEKELEDLRKARWYVDRRIAQLEAER